MLITYHDAGLITGLSRSTIERLVHAEAFPKPVRVTASRLGFVREEVEAWARDRIRARDETRDPSADPVLIATRKRAA
jgi:predicted DNA-binding transcriptional regulator AlpA